MTWRKSSYSSQSGACVEIRGDLFALRDSKSPDGPVLYTTGIRHMLRFAIADTHQSIAVQGDQ
jgi:hypothetical protein